MKIPNHRGSGDLTVGRPRRRRFLLGGAGKAPGTEPAGRLIMVAKGRRSENRIAWPSLPWQARYYTERADR